MELRLLAFGILHVIRDVRAIGGDFTAGQHLKHLGT